MTTAPPAPGAPATQIPELAPAASPAPPTLPAPPRVRRAGWRVRFAVLSLIWGFSFLLIKVGTEAYAPRQVTLGRL
ncbi:EamA/RhaT family transporter, partial [Streptomyces albidoflavus]